MPQPQPSASRPPRRHLDRAIRAATLAALTAGLIVLVASPALAQVAEEPFSEIITRLHQILVGLLVGLATLFLTVGGVRYLFGASNPVHIEKAKTGLLAAAIGYGIAALSVPLVALLRYVVGA